MKNKTYSVLITVLALVLAAGLSTGAFAGGSAPGSAEDPVVTRSYVDAQVSGLEDAVDELNDAIAELEEKIAELSSQPSGSHYEPSEPPETPESSAPAGFQVYEIPAGSKVLGSEGTQIILRSGTAYAVDNGVDGVSDLTAGADLKGDVQVSKNHLLLVPRTDGRGIRCTTLCYVMISGEFELK